MKLHELASLILAIGGQPIRRVRFAKAIYFTHKALIAQKLAQISDLKYIRLPLGPVPDGFLTLATDFPDLITENADLLGQLSYESEFLSACPDPQALIAKFDPKIVSSVQQTLSLLNTFSTPELVKHSQDPSWLTHFNGERYELTSLDLKNTFPVIPKSQKLFHSSKNPNNLLSKITIKLPQKFRLQLKIHPDTPLTEIGALQANLLRGMLKDIVKESTDLEYPDEASPKSPKLDNPNPTTPELGKQGRGTSNNE